MIPILSTPRLIGGGIILAALLAGVWYYGHTRYEAGKAIVQDELDRQRFAWQDAYDKQAADTAKIEEARDQLKWRIERELEPRLAAATDRGATLAARLREHAGRRVCALPEAAGTAAEPDGTGRESDDGGRIDAAVERHLAACARDAERLNGWREWWNEASRLKANPAP